MPAVLRLARQADVANLRAAIWAWRAARAAHRQVHRDGGLGPVELPPVPSLPARAEKGMDFVLRRSRHRCLVRAHVRQRWYLAQGQPRDLVIGALKDPEFRAHAWLDGDPPESRQGFPELTRRPAR